MWKFIIRKNEQEEIDYVLKADDGSIVLHSRSYSSDNACRKGIASVSKNARPANVEDCSKDAPSKAVKHPKFEIYATEKGGAWFQLKATNGQVVGVSGAYPSKEDCLAAIEELRKHASEAIVD